MAWPANYTDGTLLNASLMNTLLAAAKSGGGNGATAAATAGAATANEPAVKVTSESLTTGAGSTYTLTLTNSKVTASTLCFANACLGSSTNGQVQVVGCKPASGSVVIVVKNIHASQALNGTIIIDFMGLNTA